MAIMRRLAGLSGRAMALCVLVASPSAQASTEPPAPDVANGGLVARFDPSARETTATGQVEPGLCYSLSLPQEWRLETQAGETWLQAASSDARITVGLRSAEALQHLPQRDLASRDAAFLQQDYEDLLGRPAQSVSLASAEIGRASCRERV